MNFKHKYVFLFPGLFVLIGILIFPIIFTIRLSLSGWNSYTPEMNFIGITNFYKKKQKNVFFFFLNKYEEMIYCSREDIPSSSIIKNESIVKNITSKIMAARAGFEPATK